MFSVQYSKCGLHKSWEILLQIYCLHWELQTLFSHLNKFDNCEWKHLTER